MKRTSRRVVTGLLLAAGFGALGLTGCSGAGGNDDPSAAHGEIGLPLTTQGASGVIYRLRNATFVIQSQYYDYESSEAGAAGASTNPGRVVVSSETDPNARNISVSLEEGYYLVSLQSGWYLEKVTASGAQPIEATLLSGANQWVWVSRQSTSWAEYSFGVGSREIWLNGKLNIGIDVQESAGAPNVGWGGAGGAVEVPIAGMGGSAG